MLASSFLAGVTSTYLNWLQFDLASVNGIKGTQKKVSPLLLDFQLVNESTFDPGEMINKIKVFLILLFPRKVFNKF